MASVIASARSYLNRQDAWVVSSDNNTNYVYDPLFGAGRFIAIKINPQIRRDANHRDLPNVDAVAIIVDHIAYPFFVVLGAIYSAVYSAVAKIATPITAFLFNKNNHLARFLKQWEARDKTLKFAVAASETAEYIASQHGASGETLGGMRSVTRGFKDARMAVGLFNVFAGMIPNLAQALGNSVVHGLALISPKAKPPYAAGRGELALALVHELSNAASCATYIFGFGVCRPIMFVERHFGQLGETANKIGKSFGFVMMANHAASFVGSAAHLAYSSVAFDRIAEKSSAFRAADRELLSDNYLKGATEDLLNMLDKGLELTNDIMKSFDGVKNTLPPPVKLSFALTSASLGLFRMWLKTA